MKNKSMTDQANETMNKAVDLTEKTAKATLKSSVEVAKLAENSLQGLYKVGYDMNAAGLNVAKGYWDALTNIRNEWVSLFAQTGEKTIETMGTVGRMETPLQKDMADMGKDALNKAEKVVNNVTEQGKKVASDVAKTVENVAEKATAKVEETAAKAKKATAK